MNATGMVGHVGRKGVRFALLDDHGGLLRATTRQFGGDHGSSVAGCLSAFQHDLALERLPQRLAIAVAGLARGDAISITQTRWFVSRSGLQAMLGQAPLILNDFEAEAWALAGSAGTFTAFGGMPATRVEQAGTYCVLGMTSGLGVSVMKRERSGAIHVLATEAGHAGFSPGSARIADLAAAMFPNRYPLVAEHLISANGLVTIYNALATIKKLPSRATKPEEVTRRIGTDAVANEACELLCEAFWTYAGSLVLTYGAWDGVVVTGALARVLQAHLAAPRMQAVFAGTGKYARLLAAVPRTYMAVEHGELFGAAEALLRQP